MQLCIIGLDPGSTTTGVGILYLNPNTLVIEKTTAFTIQADQLKHADWMSEHHADRFRRLVSLRQELTELFRRLQPIEVGCESPFYNRFRPNAYGVLVETLMFIRQAVWDYDEKIALTTIDPPNVKKAIGAAGNAKKDGMTEALSQMTALHLDTDVHLLDEHSVDAVAVAFGTYKELLRRLYAEE